MKTVALPAGGLLRQDELRPRTGLSVRVAIIDSGVHRTHPHVRNVAGGVGIDSSGVLHEDFVDRLGHGTAVAAVIREKAPEADLWAVKVFDRDLTTSASSLARAIDWALSREVHLINLSLGTANAAHAPLLRDAVARARRMGAWIVAAGAQDNVQWLPGTLNDVVAVTLDWAQPRDTCAVDVDGDALGAIRVRASGWPRPIPGVPPERNLHGLSFAVANATGLLALALEAPCFYT
jgi:subtilisin family serine protease